MARPLRTRAGGLVYHALNRANGRAEIFGNPLHVGFLGVCDAQSIHAVRAHSRGARQQRQTRASLQRDVRSGWPLRPFPIRAGFLELIVAIATARPRLLPIVPPRTRMLGPQIC
jgi:hypothetical protein